MCPCIAGAFFVVLLFVYLGGESVYFCFCDYYLSSLAKGDKTNLTRKDCSAIPLDWPTDAHHHPNLSMYIVCALPVRRYARSFQARFLLV